MPNGNAPGPDETTNEMLKVAIFNNPPKFQRIFDRCISQRHFPTSWKHGRLALIPKPGKPADSPSSYRPICLLDGSGKLLEKVLVRRLKEYLSKNNAIADNQYDIRQGRSTLDAMGRLQRIILDSTSGHAYHHKLVGTLTLDVKNAFNSAPWEAILEAAGEKGVPSHMTRLPGEYLSKRSIEVSSPSGSIKFENTRSSTGIGPWT